MIYRFVLDFFDFLAFWVQNLIDVRPAWQRVSLSLSLHKYVYLRLLLFLFILVAISLFSIFPLNNMSCLLVCGFQYM